MANTIDLFANQTHPVMKCPVYRPPLLLPALFVLTGILGSALPAAATHIIGGEISYKSLGNNKWRIILDVYRDCSSAENAGFDAPARISLFDDAGTYLYNLNLNPSFTDSIPSNILGDPCVAPPDSICVEWAHYEGTTILPPYGGGYYISYQRCCRNEGIVSIVNPLETGATYWTYLSAASIQADNSSPYFSELPPVYVCVNKPLHHPYGAEDIDGDSLVYAFYTPFTGAEDDSPQPPFSSPPPYGNDTVVWMPGYGLSQLLGFSYDPLHIDPATGLITGTPLIQGRFVVGVEVREYRNGVELSVIRRDFQYNVGICQEIVPVIEAPATQCDDLTVAFDQDTDIAQHFLWYFDWPHDTSLVSNEPAPVFTFPDTGHYTIRLVAEPGNQCEQDTTFSLFLQYNSLTADFDLVLNDCESESFLVLTDRSEDTVSPVNTWQWTVLSDNGDSLTSDEPNPVFPLVQPSAGTVTLTAGSLFGCEDTHTMDYATGGGNPLDFLPDTILLCRGDTARLNPAGALAGFSYSWGAPVPADQQDQPDPAVQPDSTTTYPVTIYAFGNLCSLSAEVTVLVFEPVSLAFEADTDCDARVVRFVNQSQHAPFGYVWDFGDGTTLSDTSTLDTPTYQYPDYGSYTVTLATAPDAVCRDTVQSDLTLTEKVLSAAFGYQLESCAEDALTLQFSDLSQNSLGNTADWSWVFSGIYNDTLTGPNPTVVLTQEGDLTVHLTITTDEDCRSASLPVSIPVDLTELPDLPDGSETLGCLNGGVTLNPNGNPAYTYAWSPAAGLSCADCPSPWANPGQTTTYQVVVRHISVDTCDITRQVTVTVPTDLAVSLPNDLLTCDSSVTLVAAADLPPASWTWFDDAAAVIATGTDILSLPVSGDRQYVLQAADSLGCLYADTIRITGGPVDLAAAGDQVLCADTLPQVGADNLDPNDILTYTWSPDDAFDGPVDIPYPAYLPVPGTRWVYVEAENQWGCQLRDSVLVALVDVDQNLDFDFVVGCDGFQVSFTNLSTGTANHPFQWHFGDPNSPADSSSLTNPGYLYPTEGTFLVSLTMDYDLPCVDTAFREIQIEETQFLTDFEYDFLNCDEDSIQVQFLDATQLFINSIDITCWEWTTLDGQSASTQNPVFTAYAGQPFGITLKVCTSNGCEGTRSALLNFDFPVVTLADTIYLCPGDSVDLYPGAVGGYLYNWGPDLALSDPSSPNPTAWPSATQTYTVDITTFTLDTCQLSRSVTVVVPEKISLTTTGDTLTCGQPIQLVAGTNGVPTTIDWYDGQGNLIAGNSPAVSVDPDSADTYFAVATDSYQCTDTTSLSVFNRQLDLLLSGGGVIDTCPAPSYDLCVTNLDGTDDLVFEWSAGQNGTVLDCPDCACATVQTVPGTQTTFSVAVSNQFGCETVAELDITTYVFDPIFRELIVICPDVPTPINPEAAGSGLSYQWTPAVGLSCADCPDPTATLTENQFYQVTIQGFNGNDICSLTGTVQVQVNPAIALQTTPTDTVICDATDLTLQALPGSSLVTDITWGTDPSLTVPLGNGPSLTVTPSASVTYFAVATDTLGCRDTASVTVDAYPVVTNLDDQFNFCVEKGPLTIAVTNLDPAQVLSYQWSPAGPIVDANADSAVVTVDIDATTTFTVTATNQFGCTATESATVSFLDIANLVGDILLEDDTIILGSGENTRLVLPFFPGYTYQWSPEDGLDDAGSHQPLAEPTETTGYSVLVTDPAGCQVLRADTVFVISPDCREPNIFVPNAFTPNGDGENDFLYVRSAVIDQVEFAVYNRWGQQVFETTDLSVGWDGTFKGERLAPDMFGYYLKATCFDGQTFFLKGNVTILR